MLTKITEIKQQKTITRKERINGVLTPVQKTITGFVPVPYVTGWARFGHHLLDIIFVYILNLILTTLIYTLFNLFSLQSGSYNDFENENTGINFFLIFFRWLIVTPGYYLLFEYGMQSSPGKAILGRIVVDEYGEKPTLNQLLIRSYARIVPFEAFSCLSDTGWHDNWSNTLVIRKTDLHNLKLMQRIQEVEGTPETTPPGA